MSLATIVGTALRRTRVLLVGTTVWRYPLAVWVAAIALAAAFFYLLVLRRRELFEGGDKEPPNSVLKKAFKECSVGQVYPGLRKNHPSWDKYRQAPIKEQCDLGAQEFKSDKTGAAIFTKLLGFHGLKDKSPNCKYGACEVPILRGIRPCWNKKKTRCCDVDGNNCVDKDSTSERWKENQRAKVRRANEARGPKAGDSICPDGHGWGWGGNEGLCCKLDDQGVNTNQGCINSTTFPGVSACPDGHGWGWGGNEGLCCKLDDQGVNTNQGCINSVLR